MRDGSYVIVDRLCEATTQLLEIIKKQEEIIEQTFQILYDKVAANMENMTYGEKQVIEVSVTKDSNNVYSISDEDYLKLDAAMYDKDALGM